jgi:hypothetical protein
MNNITWVILRGGLGNQLFQFYNGLGHSLANESELYIDVNHIHEDLNGLRYYELNNFELPLDGSGSKHKVVGESKNEGWLFRFIKQGSRTINLSCIHPSLEILNDNLPREIPKSAIFDGYYQNAKLYDYLLSNPGLLPKLTKFSGPNINKINLDTTCAITVRLTDYLKFPEIFGNFPYDFYSKAMQDISLNFGINNFDLYSDDIKLAQRLLANVASSNFFINPIKTKNAMTDFVNISKYKFKIIANSSFSWWAAFINPGSVVYYMDPWLLKPSNLQLGLESWEKISRELTL